MVEIAADVGPVMQPLQLQLPPRTFTLFSQYSHPTHTAIFKSIEFVDYVLGDQIFDYHPLGDKRSGKIGVVCQGRVRLLIDNGIKDVTVERLDADQCFGGDYAFVAQSFSYRAVASSAECTVAFIPLSKIVAACEVNPQLKQHWLEQVQTRERLCFFRTMTDLRSHPSRQLSQWVPYLQELSLPQGTQLALATPASAGRYWLRSGVVMGDGEPPHLGDSWGYASYRGLSAADSSWIVQESSVVYQLPKAVWTVAKAISPDLDLTESLPDDWTRDSAKDSARDSINSEGAAQRNTLSSAITTSESSSLSPSLAQRRATHSLEALPPRLTKSSQTENLSPEISFPKPPQRFVLDVLRQYPWVEQQSSSDCGAACLSMVARYWGKRFPLNVLREKAQVGREGTSLKGLARAAEEIGFQARPVRASLGALAEQTRPWIAHWEGVHYVVVYRISGKKVLIADPAMGRQFVSRETFIRKWTGYGVLLDPTLQLKKTEIKQGSLGRYVPALMPYRGLIAQIILVSLLIQCFGLLSPLFTQVILDRVVVQRSISTLNVFVVGLLIFGLWGLVMGAVRTYLLSYLSNRLDLTLISGFIRHTMSLPMRFFESRRVGDIVTRVQENQKIQEFLIGQVVLAWLGFLTGFVYLGLMLYYNWQLTLIVMLIIPPIVVITLGATPFLRKISREVFKEAADQNSALVEMIGGIATIKSTATEHELRWRWEDNLTRLLNAQFRGQKFGIGLQSVSGVINSFGSTLLLWYGASLVIKGELTIGQFVAFNMMIGYVISPVLALADLWDELQEIFISIERLNDIFETKPEEANGDDQMVMPAIEGQVTFESVTFRYSEDSDRNTLENISFEVSAGDTVAIVGRSGSGKSTLIKLLEGLYSPNSGRVLVDGHDLQHVVPSSLRSQLGVVPQESILFSGTILENISFFREDVSFESVSKAAKLAEAHGFIQAMPLGYRTEVGERGATLSGGQRQRVAIARALLRQPRLLLLDEATSSLDTESERHFQQNLEQISAECTTFIIAHRLSTVRNADRILVLDRGILVEQGTHVELLAEKGLYYSLAQQQLDL
ncbi:MAG: peptidase domain-containing ABC transporter [Cyanobacteria bacterium P01_F01_bin.3]